MFRLTIVCLVVFCVSPAYSQRVFRASIDQEQNDRLDKLEDAVDRLTTLVEILATQPQPSPPEKAKPVSVQVAKSISAPAPASNKYTRYELESIVRAAYPNGNYTQYADVSPRSGVWRHLQDGSHRFTADQVSGMSQELALGLHGLHHVGRISPYKNSFQQSQQSVQQAQLVTRSVQPTRQVQEVGGCANGQCARQSYSQPVRRRIFFR